MKIDADELYEHMKLELPLDGAEKNPTRYSKAQFNQTHLAICKSWTWFVCVMLDKNWSGPFDDRNVNVMHRAPIICFRGGYVSVAISPSKNSIWGFLVGQQKSANILQNSQTACIFQQLIFINHCLSYLHFSPRKYFETIFCSSRITFQRGISAETFFVLSRLNKNRFRWLHPSNLYFICIILCAYSGPFRARRADTWKCYCYLRLIQCQFCLIFVFGFETPFIVVFGNQSAFVYSHVNLTSCKAFWIDSRIITFRLRIACVCHSVNVCVVIEMFFGERQWTMDVGERTIQKMWCFSATEMASRNKVPRTWQHQEVHRISMRITNFKIAVHCKIHGRFTLVHHLVASFLQCTAI